MLGEWHIFLSIGMLLYVIRKRKLVGGALQRRLANFRIHTGSMRRTTYIFILCVLCAVCACIQIQAHTEWPRNCETDREKENHMHEFAMPHWRLSTEWKKKRSVERANVYTQSRYTEITYKHSHRHASIPSDATYATNTTVTACIGARCVLYTQFRCFPYENFHRFSVSWESSN